MLQNKSSQCPNFPDCSVPLVCDTALCGTFPVLPDLPVLPSLPPSPDINTLIFPNGSSLLISLWESTCPPSTFSCLGQFAFHCYSQACQHFWSSHCLPCRGKGLTQLCARVLPLKASGVGNQTHPQEALEVSFQRCEHRRGGGKGEANFSTAPCLWTHVSQVMTFFMHSIMKAQLFPLLFKPSLSYTQPPTHEHTLPPSTNQNYPRQPGKQGPGQKFLYH